MAKSSIRFAVFLTLAGLVPCAQQPGSGAPAAAADVRARLQEADRALGEQRADAARQLVLGAFEVCRAAPLERDDGLLLEIAHLADRVGDLRTAHDAFERAARLRAERLPADHRDLQIARRQLAWTKLKLGDSEGALALLEDVQAVLLRTVPDDDAELQWTRLNLAGVKSVVGDLPGALELQERVVAIWSRTRPADDVDLLTARMNLGISKRGLGRIDEAHALLEQVHEAWLRVYPEDHPKVLAVRQALAATKADLRDLEGARDLIERVYEVRKRTLPADHPELQFARQGLGLMLHELGDLRGSVDLLEEAAAVMARTLPEDHPQLQQARLNLALVKESLGDLVGARTLEEKAYEVCSRTLPDDHHDLQAARGNLAATLLALGDLAGARALFEKVHEIAARNLPEDHPERQYARANLAAMRKADGDLAGALALEESIYEALRRTLPDGHVDLQIARQNLAATKADFGDLDGARALEEKALAMLSEALPADHPHVLSARQNLALRLRQLGEMALAKEHEERLYESRCRVLPTDHPDLQRARSNLAWTLACLGEAGRAADLAIERAAIARQRLESWLLSPRELGAMAVQESEALDLLLTLAGGFGPIEARPSLASQALVLSQTLRGVETRSAQRWREARGADPQRARVLERELAAAIAETGRAADEALAETSVSDRAERLMRAVARKERAQRALGEIAAGGTKHVSTATAEHLAAALPERSAAAAVVGFTHATFDTDHPGRTIGEPRLAAIVLQRGGAVTLRPLGARSEVEELVKSLRRQAGAGGQRGLAPLEGEDPLAVQKALRARVLDPILAAAGDVDTLWLSVDESLELVPLDALAGDDGAPLGTKVALRPLVSLLDLLEPPGVAADQEPTLLAAGGLDYDEAGDDAALTVIGGAVTPPAEDTRAGRPGSFRVLPSSTTEVNALAQYFGKAFGAQRAQTWTGTEADKAALVAAAPRATFVHLATHGFFAPEAVRSATGDHRTPGAVTGLSPLVLCGLALSGANLAPDDFGRHAGILTAEEILSLDLSHCHLVTLSACDTSLGVRRAGQGYASLRAALQGAGARFVLTSLWKVGDEATMELMIDFYRRLWVQKKEPHAALWEAKMEARRQGAAFRDWAGWVLTGR